MKIEILDLDFMNTEQVVASFLLLGEDGASAALVETGPTNCLDRLTAGLKGHGVSDEDVPPSRCQPLAFQASFASAGLGARMIRGDVTR